MVNPMPQIRTVKEDSTLVIIDGGGGLGYLPTVLATREAIKRAKSTGLGAGVVRHIGHYGAAGIYTRMCAEAGCIGFSVQGSIPREFPDLPVALLGWPPMSFAIPAGSGPPIVLDAGTRFFGDDDVDLFGRIPAAFFKSLGFTVVAKVLGGVLTGQMLPEGQKIQEQWPSHAGGAFVFALDVAHFVSEEDFRKEIDRMHRDIASQMRPMPGYDRALLPGALEAEREEAYRLEGIPISKVTQQRVTETAKEYGVSVPWRAERSL